MILELLQSCSGHLRWFFVLEVVIMWCLKTGEKGKTARLSSITYIWPARQLNCLTLPRFPDRIHPVFTQQPTAGRLSTRLSCFLGSEAVTGKHAALLSCITHCSAMSSAAHRTRCFQYRSLARKKKDRKERRRWKDREEKMIKREKWNE